MLTYRAAYGWSWNCLHLPVSPAESRTGGDTTEVCSSQAYSSWEADDWKDRRVAMGDLQVWLPNGTLLVSHLPPILRWLVGCSFR